MQISLKLIRGINHAKSTVCMKFKLLVTFNSLFTASSSLSVFARSVLYIEFKSRSSFAHYKELSGRETNFISFISDGSWPPLSPAAVSSAASPGVCDFRLHLPTAAFHTSWKELFKNDSKWLFKTSASYLFFFRNLIDFIQTCVYWLIFFCWNFQLFRMRAKWHKKRVRRLKRKRRKMRERSK